MFNHETKKVNVDQAATRHKRSFKLVRYFTAISLISIVITGVLLGVWVRQFSVENLILSEERNNIALTQVIVNSVWSEFGDFIDLAGKLNADEIRAHGRTQELNAYINKHVLGINIYKIKIYNLDGRTVFSTDFKQIGKPKSTHSSFKSAKQGQVDSKLSFRDRIYAKNEFIQNRNVIASYLPVRQGEKNEILAVFEVYKDVTPMIREINRTQVVIVSGVVGALIVLFLVLYFFIRHADKIIQQHDRIQEQVTDKISQVAFYDSLTELPNRVLFLDRLEHAMRIVPRSQKLVALMFIDLDRFKQVNDSLGHEAGDELLHTFANRLSSCVREGDTVARLSGDEFTILLENLQTIEFAITVAQRIVNVMEKPFVLGSNEVNVSCSIGVSIYPFDDDDARSLMKKADAAMYFSKSYGRNNYHIFSPDMLHHGGYRYELESELHSAIAESQFRVFFQPKVNLLDGTMCGMEALVRWQHPQKGMIPPGDFISVLEETGMIIEVGEWILRESCRLTKKWHDEGLPSFRVAVNVSAIQFHQPKFFAMVDHILDETGLEAQYLELELTESFLMENIEEQLEGMRTLMDKGVMLTIDDFGTGYSSLSYLSKLPVGTLKIDRAFIHDMMENRENRAIVTAIISFAHGLKKDVIAEGIETYEQLMFVNALHCTTVQGYLISKPLSEEDFYLLCQKSDGFKHLFEPSQKGLGEVM